MGLHRMFANFRGNRTPIILFLLLNYIVEAQLLPGKSTFDSYLKGDDDMHMHIQIYLLFKLAKSRLLFFVMFDLLEFKS